MTNNQQLNNLLSSFNTDLLLSHNERKFVLYNHDFSPDEDDEDDELEESDPLSSSHCRGDILGISGMGMV